jgi:hypothetical protein
MRFGPFLVALLTGGLALAGDNTARENLLGTWELQNSATHESWSLESDGAVLHVVRKDDGKVNLDLRCKPDGSECTGTDEGKKVRVTMYFNGAALVQIETRDQSVIKRRFELDGQDDLKIDLNPLNEPAKRHSLQLVRQVRAAV